MLSDLVTARTTTGERYSGNQRFQGNGMVRSCDRCLKHGAFLEGWRRTKYGMTCPSCVKRMGAAK